MPTRSKFHNRQRNANVYVLYALFALPFLISVAAIAMSTSLSWSECFGVVYLASVSGLIFIMVLRWWTQKNFRGEVLYSTEADPSGYGGIMMGVFYFLLACERSIFELSENLVFNGLSFLPLIFSLIVLNYVMCTKRLEFCENWIWAFSNLTRWNDLETYEWKHAGERKKSALRIKYTNWLLVSAKREVDIPDEDKETVEELLKQYAPSAIKLVPVKLQPLDDFTTLQAR
ncbi:MAG TPA: DUF5673 domain-containing protein, partial [Planctomycetaceae bacterium]|nr:DUF5673 domain-containing protein [Planctomycetaceae bacterium]